MTHILKTFFPVAFVLAIGTGCNWHPSHKNIDHAEKLLASGELSETEKVTGEMIRSYDLSSQERAKIDSILEICYRIRKDFTLSEEEVIQQLNKFDTKLSPDLLYRFENEHKVDFILLDGRKRYFKNCVSNIFRLDSFCAQLKTQMSGVLADSLSIFRRSNAGAVLANAKLSGQPVMPVRMKLSYTITVHAGSVPAGDTIRCWMPFPRENNSRQQDIHLIETFPVAHQISPATDRQRTIYLEQISSTNQPAIFHSEMEITSYAQSFQLSPEMMKPYQKESAIYKEFTAEKAPQILFNQNIKSLVKNILKEETNPLLQVRKIYNWINDSVTWASALEYSIMRDIPGFVMLNRHGDCGMQTLLFMALARSAGIPVKWQSGWMLHPGHVNLHDWCEVWYEGIGWVPLDQSFGLQESSDEKIRDFYITGIDAYRFIVNDDISQPLTPSKKFLRSEPYDFQRGEVEWKEGNLYFDKWSWHMEVSYY